tara:strand:- start:14599 stop:15330 length:732 start_codon:yes stop_codon:yes gene_type:complete
MKNYIKIVFFLGFFQFTLAQGNNYSHCSSWNSFVPKVTFDKSFCLVSEFHFRRTKFLNDWEQFVFRSAVHFKQNQTCDFSLGYSYIQNYSFADYSISINVKEHNIWQQLQLNHVEGQINFKHRFRLEERFIDNVLKLSYKEDVIKGQNYCNRFRYRFTIELPILKIYKTKKISVKIFDEIFVNLKKGIRPISINQNWLYVGLGYPVTSKMALGIGYQHIGLNSNANTFIANHILQTTMSYTVH